MLRAILQRSMRRTTPPHVSTADVAISAGQSISDLLNELKGKALDTAAAML
jgi:hypothetical protein